MCCCVQGCYERGNEKLYGISMFLIIIGLVVALVAVRKSVHLCLVLQFLIKVCCMLLYKRVIGTSSQLYLSLTTTFFKTITDGSYFWLLSQNLKQNGQKSFSRCNVYESVESSSRSRWTMMNKCLLSNMWRTFAVLTHTLTQPFTIFYFMHFFTTHMPILSQPILLKCRNYVIY